MGTAVSGGEEHPEKARNRRRGVRRRGRGRSVGWSGGRGGYSDAIGEQVEGLMRQSRETCRGNGEAEILGHWAISANSSSGGCVRRGTG